MDKYKHNWANRQGGTAVSDQSTTATANFLRPRLREGAFIGITAACVYLLLSLISYTPDDPGWSATATTDYVSNAGGPTGAWLADVFFSLIGYLAYLFPLMLAYRAWILFQHRFESVLKLPSVLASGNQCTDIECDQLSILQRLGYISRNNSLCQTLDYRGLSNAWLSDQNGIVFRAP